MDETVLGERLAEELIAPWEVVPTGNGFLVVTDWRWPNEERIEVHVRRVAQRDDLYLVTDGGELCNFLFAKGMDLRQDPRSMELLEQLAAESGAGMIDYQIVRGAGDEDLSHCIRRVLEAIKEGAFVFWRELSDGYRSWVMGEGGECCRGPRCFKQAPLPITQYLIQTAA